MLPGEGWSAVAHGCGEFLPQWLCHKKRESRPFHMDRKDGMSRAWAAVGGGRGWRIRTLHTVGLSPTLKDQNTRGYHFSTLLYPRP